MQTSSNNILETINLIALRNIWLHELQTNIVKKLTIKQFLHKCGAKRVSERKLEGVWYTDLLIFNSKKWLLAKIKYGL